MEPRSEVDNLPRFNENQQAELMYKIFAVLIVVVLGGFLLLMHLLGLN
jgi:hypothetical protein